MSSAVNILGYSASLLDPPQVETVYEHLSRVPGLVGLAARYAMQKQHVSKDNLAASSERPAHSGPRATAGPQLPCAEIYAIFSPCVGEEKAGELVRAAMRKLQLPEDALGKADVLRVLEELASVPGIVGVTARFAKARVILRFT